MDNKKCVLLFDTNVNWYIIVFIIHHEGVDYVHHEGFDDVHHEGVDDQGECRLLLGGGEDGG